MRRPNKILEDPTPQEWRQLLKVALPTRMHEHLTDLKSGRVTVVRFATGEGSVPASWNKALKKANLSFRFYSENYGARFSDKAYRLYKIEM